MPAREPIKDLVFAVTILAVHLGAFVVPVAIGVLTPGRKGTMRTTRAQKFAAGDVNQLRDLYARRLQHEGFSVRAENGGLAGKRTSADLAEAAGALPTHAALPYSCTIQFVPQPDGIEVHLTMWTASFIIVDTGEGPYIDLLIERILLADQARQESPIVANRSLAAVTSMWCGIFLLAGALLLFVPVITGQVRAGLTRALLMSSISPFFLSGLAAFQIFRRPKEIHGKVPALVGVGLAVLGATITAALALLG